MTGKDEKEIDAFITQLTGDEETDDPKYPLPQDEPIRYTGVDVVILPKGYKGYPTPDSKQRFTDSMGTMKIDLDAAEEKDDILRVPVTVANAGHVYNYDSLRVRKPLDELKAVASFAENRPITREHPVAGIVTDRREVMGFFKTPVIENETLKGILEISDKDLIADVKLGKLTDVSPGFFCDLNRDDSGDIEGEHYDATQKNIFLDHVAIVEKGRCSIEDGCGIGLDAKTPVPQSVMSKIENAIESAKAMKEKDLEKLLRGILKEISVAEDSGNAESVGIDTADIVKIREAFETVTAERDSLRGELDAIVKTEKDSLIASLTSAQSTKTKEDLKDLSLDALKKELEMVKSLRVKRLAGQDSGGGRDSGKTRIDEAYSKIGE
jgi:hypothetical protein